MRESLLFVVHLVRHHSVKVLSCYIACVVCIHLLEDLVHLLVTQVLTQLNCNLFELLSIDFSLYQKNSYSFVNIKWLENIVNLIFGVILSNSSGCQLQKCSKSESTHIFSIEIVEDVVDKLIGSCKSETDKCIF